ncbi:MAG: serine hydrolase [Candidatus Cryptobacteroides sp.]|nr:serine hydrolase [Candidatus Cryptobacteroides sp.]
MKKRNVGRLLLCVVVLALLGGCLYLNTLMPIITGYAAKNLASAVFVSGRDPQDVEQLDLNFSFIKYTRNKVDYEHKTVRSRFLWASSTAAFREGYGVTLLRGKDKEAFLAQAYPLPKEPDYEETLQQGDSAEIARLEPLAKAFVDDKSYNGNPFAFVVLHKGKIVAERYGKGITPETKLLSWSMGKSFTSTLVGIMADDSLVNVYTPMDIPEWQGDDRKNITINDLLQMQSGLEWNEDYGNRSDVNLMLHREEDMGLYALNKPLEHAPGTFWYYSSGTTNIVMRYLRSKFPSDQAFLTYQRERLFGPLRIDNPIFEPDMSGTPVGSSYLYATARDFARFGQMYLDDGCAGGHRILPEGWVDYTVTPASASAGRYGAFFWLNRCKVCPDVPEDMFSCNGHDGQQIYMIPSKDLVVVVLGYSPKHCIDFNALLKDIIQTIDHGE